MVQIPLQRGLSTELEPNMLSGRSEPGEPSSCTQSQEQFERDEQVQQLAREFTNASEKAGVQNPFHAPSDKSLDPASSDFSAKEWARAFFQTLSKTSPRRTAGLAFQNLSVYGHGTPTDYQKSVGNTPLGMLTALSRGWSSQQQKIDILHGVDGLVEPGEMLCVLGPPGSGCSTLLKTIAGDTYGLNVAKESRVNYQGITPDQMHSAFRGEAIYTAEVDAHFPMLSVNDTLYFAAMARSPYALPAGVDRKRYATHLRDVIMAMFGIAHTNNTQVGNDYVRGVSGGERKRVTIAEAALSNAPLQCWDNSTRGLDSANAVEFCRTLKIQSDIFNFTSCVAIYQAPQAAFDLFDKVTVLYEGRQIYFGSARNARLYFEELGFECQDIQTTPDFLTSMTNPAERVIRSGHEKTVPRTAEEFEVRWKESKQRQELLTSIKLYNDQHPFENDDLQRFADSRRMEKSTKQRTKSPFTLSYWSQIRLCMWREWQKLKTDPSVTIVMLLTNFIEALIIASIFYNLQKTTDSFFARGAVLFMLILLNAFGSLLEILGLYAKRSIVEKHNRYALYHPSAEAISSVIMDMPYKICNAILVNTTLYFMANLRREAGPFFYFLLVSFTILMAMSMFFRLFASLTKTIAQALAPSGVVLTVMVLYTGFVIPIEYMRGWASWLRWLNPVSYGFEAIVLNEFVGRQYTCSQFVPSGPGYENIGPDNSICATKGARPGQSFVSGEDYVRVSYNYLNSHRWRNFGILVGITIGLAIIHLVVSELVAAERSKGEVLLFRRSKMRKGGQTAAAGDEEAASRNLSRGASFESDETQVAKVQKQTSTFHWQDVTYQIKIKGDERTILDRVDGWVKPGTLTALMGVSGAGKTTLLDVLASRTTIGVITGEMLVDGRQRDGSFQRKTGYVQQQDLHLHTSTVREALEFSALLRQPDQYSREEKLAYVETVIELLNMRDYADAVVGVPGEGLNVEQRKRLTIGVELAARPSLLLFLDEPTSGLDSQTSWSICNLMKKLTQNGQAILCTIHQPSAALFEQFDRLLLLAKGGRTVYFGEIGSNARTLVDYFVQNGSVDCPAGVNPAEFMLETIGAAPGSRSTIDWPDVWRKSNEYHAVKQELARLSAHDSGSQHDNKIVMSSGSDYTEFASPAVTQMHLVLKRTFQQYWRTPAYLYSKMLLCIGAAMLIGFSLFMTETTQQGLQNQMFGVFIFLFIIVQLILQIIPMFVVQRTLYEARERQSRTYRWQAFVLSNIIVEFFWNTLVAVVSFMVWYYPMGLYRLASWTDAVHSRGALAFLFIWCAFLFGSSFAHAIIAGISSDQVASAVANLFSIMLYAFCGILAGPNALPGFWIFMYRVNPFTYLVDGLLSTTLANAPVQCATDEFLRFSPPAGQSCSTFMQDYISAAGGYLANVSASGSTQCEYCPLNSTNQFLRAVNVDFGLRWRNFGLLWVYIIVNLFAAIAFYWLFRVPSKRKSQPTVGRK